MMSNFLEYLEAAGILTLPTGQEGFLVANLEVVVANGLPVAASNILKIVLVGHERSGRNPYAGE